MSSKQNSPEALFVDLLRDQGFRANSILGAELEQSSKPTKINKFDFMQFDFIREHVSEDVCRHKAG